MIVVFMLIQRHRNAHTSGVSVLSQPQPIAPQNFPAFQGREHTAEAIEAALLDADPWLDVEHFDTSEALVEDAADSIAAGKVVAWFQGRSEFGQRALGSRSVLADPSVQELRRVINQEVKQREWYRPLAPSVLDEHVGEWFEKLRSGENASPYMSLTATVRPEKIARVSAVCHIDNTARLQTVTKTDAPLYHRLISAFFRLTGIPMVLNTSFNRKNQPIVETPAQAVETFLLSDRIDHLYIGLKKVTARTSPFTKKGETTHGVCTTEPTESESALFVCGSPIYLSEVTSNSAAAAETEPMKVRVQAGRSLGAADEELGEEAPPAWTTLPSAVHLDILQLLQANDELLDAHSSEDGDQGAEAKEESALALASESDVFSSDLTVGELFEALRAIEADVLGGCGSSNSSSEVLTWPVVRDALDWLNAHQLVSFGPST